MTTETLKTRLKEIAEECDQGDPVQRAAASILYFLCGVVINGRIVKIHAEIFPIFGREARINKVNGN